MRMITALQRRRARLQQARKMNSFKRRRDYIAPEEIEALTHAQAFQLLRALEHDGSDKINTMRRLSERALRAATTDAERHYAQMRVDVYRAGRTVKTK